MSNKKRTNNILCHPERSEGPLRGQQGSSLRSERRRCSERRSRFDLLDKVAEMGIDQRDLVDPQRRRFLLRSIETSTTLTAEVKFGLISGILAFFYPKETIAQIIPFGFWKTNTPTVTGPTVQTTFAAGELWGFGGNWYGQFGDGTSYNRSSPVQVAGLWTMADGGSAHTIMLKPDNTLWAVGRNNYGQLGANNTTTLYTPAQIATGFNAIGPGRYNALAVKTDGTLWAWGQNKNGALGLGDTVYRSSPVQVGGSWLMVQSSASADSGTTFHTLGIKSDGSLWAWGVNVSGQLGVNNTTSYSSPVQVSSDRWIKLAVSGGASMAIKEDKTLWSWGSDDGGQLGLNTLWVERSSPVQVGGSWLQIMSGRQHFAGIKTDYTLWTWGYGDNGELGQNSTTNRSSPTQIPGSWVSVGGGGDHTTAVRNDGSLWTWGSNTVGQLAQNNTTALSSPVQIGGDYNWKYALQTSGNFSLAMRGNTAPALVNSTPGALFGWGYNGVGTLRIGANTYVTSPILINANYQYITMGSGYTTSMAIRADGTMWGAGIGLDGALGNNLTANYDTAQNVPGSWKQVSGFSNAFAAIDSQDRLFTWGNNIAGKLGHNDINNKSSPVQIFGGGSWKMVGAGSQHALAIKTDGTLWAWGSGLYGMLGLYNDLLSRSSPTQVGSDSNWLKANCTYKFSMALKTDGSLWAWGQNQHGQLGQNDVVSRSSPVQIPGTWLDFSSTWTFTMALKSDGTLWGWGANSYGCLGDNSTVFRSSPVQITDWKWNSVTNTNSSSFGIRDDGTLWAWGGNSYYELGLGDTTHRSTPTLLSSDSDWAFVDGYGGGTMAIKGEPVVVSGITATYLNAGSTSGFSVTVPANCNALVAFGAGEDATLVHAFNYIKFDGTEFTNVVNETSANTAPANTSSIWVLKNPIAGTGNITWTSNTGGPENVQVFAITGVSGDVYYRTGQASSASAATTSFNWVFETEHQDSLVFTNLSLGDTVASDPTLTGTNFTWSTNGRMSFNSTATQILHYKDGSGSPKSLPLNFAFPSAGRPTCTTIEFTTERRAWAYSLWAWGYNNAGSVGDGTTTFRSSPVQIPGEWLKVAAGEEHTLGIQSDNSLWSWGWGDSGRLGSGNATDRSSPVQLAGEWRDVSANSDGSGFAIKFDGSMWSWGIGYLGVTGHGNTTDYSSPVQIGSDNFWKKLAQQGGDVHMAAIRNDGSLWLWGSDWSGRLGQNTYAVHVSSPVQVFGGGVWKDVVCSWDFTIALKGDGTLWSWGYNLDGQLGLGDTISRSTPSQIGSHTWKEVSAREHVVIAIRSDDTIWTWGRNADGQLGQGNTTTRSSPVQVTGVGISVGAGESHSHVVKKDKSLWSAGANQNGQLGIGTASGTDETTHVRVGTLNDWAQVTASDYTNTFGLRDNVEPITYQLFTWGRGSYGALGTNSTTHRSSPVQVSGNWNQIFAIEAGFIGARADQSLWGWGWGGDGIFGLGDAVSRSNPTHIPGAWKQFSTGDGHRLVIRSDGTLWTTGFNNRGQLGTNNTTNRSSPVQVGSANDWAKINPTKGDQSFVIKQDGKLFAWGYNGYGVLGDGTVVNRSSPVQIAGSWMMVAGGAWHTIALKSDYTLWGWGINHVGQLGQNNLTHRSSPVQIAGSWQMIAAGFGTSIGMKTDGSVWIWGDNRSGQLGDGTTEHRSSPIQLAGNWIKFDSGQYTAAAIKDDGTLWTWGQNTYGETGHGDVVFRSSPVQVGSSSSWVDVKCNGWDAMGALKRKS